MERNVTYKEPAGYFNADMKKAAREYEKKQAEKSAQAQKTAAKKPATKGKK